MSPARDGLAVEVLDTAELVRVSRGDNVLLLDRDDLGWLTLVLLPTLKHWFG